MQIRSAENIRRLRKEHSMTQEQLADALGVTPGAVYKWEAGLSVPDVRILMEIADLFDSSVDLLLGYVQHTGNVEGRIRRIQELMASKDTDEAIAEAESALKRYPNNFRLTYTCAFVYMVKTSEDKCRDSMRKSNELFEKAIDLMDRSTSGDISEVTILNYMATNYMAVCDLDKALEILRKNNIRNINGSLISFLYGVELGKPDEAIPYVKKTVIEAIISLDRTVYGASFSYALKKDEECISSLKWLCGFLDSMKTDPGLMVYTDKSKAIALALLSVWEEMFGYEEDAASHIKEAHELAKRFDEDPVFDARGIRFIDDPEAKLIDSFGKSVMEDIDTYVFDKVPKNKASRKIRKIWDDLMTDPETVV